MDTKRKMLKISEGLLDSLCSQSDNQIKMAEENKLMAARGTDTLVFGVEERAVTHSWTSWTPASIIQDVYSKC